MMQYSRICLIVLPLSILCSYLITNQSFLCSTVVLTNLIPALDTVTHYSFIQASDHVSLSVCCQKRGKLSKLTPASPNPCCHCHSYSVYFLHSKTFSSFSARVITDNLSLSTTDLTQLRYHKLTNCVPCANCPFYHCSSQFLVSPLQAQVKFSAVTLSNSWCLKFGAYLWLSD